MGNITNWAEQADANTPTVQAMQYDPVNQLLNSTTFSNTVAGAILKQYAYNYDPAGNRTSEQIGTTNAAIALSQSAYNSDNQVTNRISNGGKMIFAGNISRAGTVTVNSAPAAMSVPTTNFVGYVNTTTGTNVIQIIATDYGNHSRTNSYQVVVTNNGVAETFAYDSGGNLTDIVSASGTNSYQWDAANRLLTISQLTTTDFQQSVFVYDGLGRRVQDIEETNGVAYTTNKFIWDGKALVEQRDLTGGSVVKRFFGEGEQIAGANYYFTRDHLGSVREMTDINGTIQARYDYDPYGRQARISGTMNADFGYAGMFVHQPSGLFLTFFRAYSAELGRWLSRDPIAEVGGLNLYDYVLNSPTRLYDPYGLCNGSGGEATGGADSWSISQGWTGPDSWALNQSVGQGLETVSLDASIWSTANDLADRLPGNWRIGTDPLDGEPITLGEYTRAAGNGFMLMGLGLDLAEGVTGTKPWLDVGQDSVVGLSAWCIGGPYGAGIGAVWLFAHDDINSDAEAIFQTLTDLKYGVNPATDWTIGDLDPYGC